MSFSILSSINRDDVFIGQSFIYTVTIKADKYTDFTLNAPMAHTAVTLRLDGLRYENGQYTQQYIIIPVQAGPLELGKAVAYVSRMGENYNPYAQFFAREQADKGLHMFQSGVPAVQVRPADSGCLPWLVATDVQAVRKLDGDVVAMAITAYGQLGQLIEKPDMPGMVIHGHADTEITHKGIIGRRSDSWRVQGNTVLPALEVKWWDENAGICRVTQVPPLYVPNLVDAKSALHQPMMWLVLGVLAMKASLFVIFVIMVRNYFRKKQPRDLYPL